MMVLKFLICRMRVFIFFIQRDTTGLSSENTELKLRLQVMEQQAHLRDGKIPKNSISLAVFFIFLHLYNHFYKHSFK